jgi:hypothetical protein
LVVPEMSQRDAVTVAGRWEQNAVVWVDGDGAALLITRDGFAGLAPGCVVR